MWPSHWWWFLQIILEQKADNKLCISVLVRVVFADVEVMLMLLVAFGILNSEMTHALPLVVLGFYGDVFLRCKSLTGLMAVWYRKNESQDENLEYVSFGFCRKPIDVCSVCFHSDLPKHHCIVFHKHSSFLIFCLW